MKCVVKTKMFVLKHITLYGVKYFLGDELQTEFIFICVVILAEVCIVNIPMYLNCQSEKQQKYIQLFMKFSVVS